ncbi:MAG: IPT/TIG domain-containing protein [Acidimicrobiales bacterium]
MSDSSGQSRRTGGFASGDQMSVDFEGKDMSAYERQGDTVQESNKGPFTQYDRGGHAAVDEQETVSSRKGTMRSFSRMIASVSIALMAGLGMLPFLGSTAFAATSVTSVTGPSPSPATAGASSLYTIGFTTSSSGALASGTGTITLAGPAGTVFPSTASAYTVQGIAVSAAPSLSNSNATVTITTPTAIGNSIASVSVVANGVTNPPAGGYTMAVSTSADTTPVSTTGYSISATATAVTSVTGPTPSGPNSNYAGKLSIYTIGFKTSATGALAVNSGEIVLSAPSGTTFSATDYNYTVNNVAVASTPALAETGGSTTDNQVTLVTPVPVADSASVTVVAYDVTNPSAGSYTLDASTSSDLTPVATSSYSIVTAPTAVSSVTLATTPTPVLAGGTASYLVHFDATNGIASNGSITLTGPTGTAFSSTPSSYTVNGVAAATIVSGGGTDSVTIANPAGAIASAAIVTVNASNVTDTTTTGSNTLYVSDSTDQAPTASSSFTVATEITGLSGPAPTSAASGATATYAYSFTTSKAGALAVSSGTITLAAPTGTLFDTTATDYTVNNVAAATLYEVSSNGTCTTTTYSTAADAVCIVTPVAVADSASVTVVVAGVTNPTVTTNTAENDMVLTSADGYAVATPSYTISSATAVSDVTVSDSSKAYSIGFIATGGIASTGTISIVAPTGVEFPASTGSNYTVNTVYVLSTGVSGFGTNSVTITNPAGAIATGATVTVAVTVTTDASTGRYQATVSDSTDTTPVTSNWYNVGSPTAQSVNGVTGPSISPNNFTGTTNTYVLSFNTSSSGGLNADSGTVSLTASASSTILPTSASDYVVNGVAASAVSQVFNGLTDTYAAIITTPVTVGASSTVTVTIFDVTNPSSSSTTDYFAVLTSIDSASAVNGPDYTIVTEPNAVSSPTWAANDNAAGQAALYTVKFTTSATGALAAGSGTITLAVTPGGTTFPSANTAYTVNGVVASSVALSNSNSTVTITTGVAIAISTAVTVVISGVTNGPVVSAPSTTYAMQIITSSDALPLASPPTLTIYTGVSKVTGPIISNLASGALAVQYFYGFTTSATGALSGASSPVSTVTVVAPTGTTLPTATPADFVVDGVAGKTAITTSCPSGLPSGMTVCATVTLRSLQAIPDAAAGTLVINDVTNPSTPGTYVNVLSTSADQAFVPSQPYTIESHVTSVTGPSPTPNGSGQAAVYTVGFTTSPTGALAAGTGTITLAAPAGTVFPSAATAYTVNVNNAGAVAASTVVLSNSNATATITTPTAVAVSTLVSVVVSGVTNPGAGTGYLLNVSTSVDLAPESTPTYAIAGAVGGLTGPSPTPGTPASSATYTVGFTTSATGALAANSGTITLSVPGSSTVFPSTAADYTVDGTAATSVSGGGTSAVTITTPVAIGNSAAVKIVASTVTNPSTGTYTMAVSTSSDTVAVDTSPYAIGTSVSSVTGPNPSSNLSGASATYTVGFTTSATGALSANTGSITFTAPSGMVFAASAGDYTVNGTAAAAISGGGTDTVTVTTPVSVAASTAVKVVVTGVTNPAMGSYTLAVNTSADIVPVSTSSYSIIAQPAVTGISPTSGSTTGGTAVTITGTNFASGATVMFGTVAGTAVTVSSSTSIVATSPAESAGTVDVTVTSNGLTSATSSADQFTFVAPATVTGISPTSGPTTGGTAVTITGTNFASGATVMFGTVTATAVTVSSSTSIVATSPAESAGTIDVTVTSNGVTSATSSADQFTFVAPISGSAYTAVNPARIVDTRCAASSPPKYCAGENLPTVNATLATLPAGKTATVQVDGTAGLPGSGVTAVVVNVTAENFNSSGYLTLYPQGVAQPTVSNLNWASTQSVVTNLATVPVSNGGEITVANGSGAGSVNYELDVQGYYSAQSGTAGLYNAITPARLADTRCSESPQPSYCASESLPSANSSLTMLGVGGTDNVTVTGVGGVPSSGVSAVVLNVTATGTTGGGYFTVSPAGTTKATVSNVNWVKGETVPNRVIVKVGANGQVSVYNNSGGANLIVDVSGYYTDGSSSTQTGSLFNPVTPARIVDTRCTTSSPPSNCSSLPSANSALKTMGPASSMSVAVAGNASIPSDAIAFVGNVTVVGPTAGGYLTVYPSGSTPSGVTSDLNFSAGQTTANMVQALLNSSGGVMVYNSAGNTNVIVDVSGWFTPSV